MFFQSLCLRVDAIFFTETWLTKHESLPNFGEYKCQCLVRGEKRGGAISIYVREGLTHYVIEDFSVINSNIEYSAACIEKTFIAVINKPPPGNKLHFYTFIESLLNSLGLPAVLSLLWVM